MMSDDTHSIGQIRQQVITLERGHSELREDVRSVRSDMKTGFDSILARIDTKTTPHWQPISIAVSIMMGIGTFFYTGIKDAQTELKTDLKSTTAQMVSRDEHNREWAVDAEWKKTMREGLNKNWAEDRNTEHEFYYLKGQLSERAKKNADQ